MDNKELENFFHRSRRMFIIYSGALFIAPKKVPLSHWEWVESENIIKNKNIFNESIRGFVDSDGVYFYKGDDFSINKKGEKIFFKKLNEIIHKMEIDSNRHVFGGMIKQDKIGKWLPKNDYGTVEFLKNTKL